MKIENIPSMTRLQLLDLAARKKIPVKQSLLKKELVGAVRRGLRKIEREKAKKSAGSKTKKTSASKKTRGPIKKASAKKSAKAKTKNFGALGRTSTAPVKTKIAGTRSKTKILKKTARKKAHVKRRAALKVVKSKSTVPPKITALPTPPPEKIGEDHAAKFILGAREIHDEAQAEKPPEPAHEYGDHHLVFLPRDPYWAYMYWELQADRIDQALASLGYPHPVNWVLRVYSPADTRHQAGTDYFDTPIDVDARKGYLHLAPPGGSFIAELGIVAPSGNFARVVVSNAISLPRDRPSDALDEKWALSPEEISFHYAESYGEASKSLKSNASSLGSRLSNNPTSPRPK